MVTAMCWLGAANTTWGAILWNNPITGPNPGADNPYTTGQTFDADLTVSGIGRGAGINAAGTTANRYNATSWNTASIDTTAYFTFTLTPNSGKQINFTSFVYTGQASATGPTSFAFRSSLDFTLDIGTPTATGTTISLSDAAYQNISSAIEFRLYGWGASDSTGTFSVNDFTFNGSVVPEPTTWAMIAFGALFGTVQLVRLCRRHLTAG